MYRYLTKKKSLTPAMNRPPLSPAIINRPPAEIINRPPLSPAIINRPPAEIINRPPELPEDIIRIILSYLPTKDAVQTSLVSKTWLSASSQLQNLEFSHSTFLSLENFTQFVNTTLLRQSKHNLPINSFKLSLPVSDIETTSFINKWLNVVVARGVKHLSISLSLEIMITYTLHNIIFTSDLISLEICDPVSEFKPHLSSFSLANPVGSQLERCHTLKRLHLERVRIEESTILLLSSVFPSIEELHIDDCFEQKTLSLIDFETVNFFDFLNLKKLYMRSFSVSVNMNAVKNLESLTFTGKKYVFRRSHHITSLFTCQNLKYLRLDNLGITDTDFHALMSHCPSLEDLVIIFCPFLERINISNNKLKRMELRYLYRLEKVKIDAPNLVAFEYACRNFPTFSVTSVSTNFKSCVHVITDTVVETAFMVKLRGFLMQLNLSRFCLTIKCLNNYFSFEKINMAPILCYRPIIENLEVSISSSSVSYLMLLDGLFWSFFPETLTVFYTSNENLELINLICKELMDIRCSSCYNSNQIMCWRHYLRYAEVEYHGKEGEDLQMLWYKLDTRSLVDGLHSLRDGSEVRFTFIW